MDLFPTLSEIIETKLPSNRQFDGESLLSLINGGYLNRSADAPFYYYNCENLQAVRMGEWKLHLPREEKQIPFWDRNKQVSQFGQPLLYNLQTDPGESQNVADSNPEVVSEILGLAQKTRRELGEFMRPGSSQRSTGSIYPTAPVISHPKDWGSVPREVIEKLEAERKRRHPDYQANN